MVIGKFSKIFSDSGSWSLRMTGLEVLESHRSGMGVSNLTWWVEVKDLNSDSVGTCIICTYHQGRCELEELTVFSVNYI